ncbi:hypothetical protein Tco_0490373 [Tanacetum coccineum]
MERHHEDQIKAKRSGLKDRIRKMPLSYAFSDSLLLTLLCCDDIHDVTPRVSALAGCDRLVSEPLVIENSLIPLSRGSFDVIVGMDWLSKRKFVIVCHEKVVRIPLEGDEILQVHGERTQGVVKTLMNTKVEFRIDLVHGATSVAKSPYRLAPLEMQELSEQLRELQDKVLELLMKEKLYAKFTKSEAVKNWEKGRVKLRRVRAISMTIQSSVKDKILATSSETSKVENAPAEMLCDLDQQMEKRVDDGKANVVTYALSRKERVKPRRVRAMDMTIQYGVRGMILTAQSEAFNEMDEAHASRNLVHPGADKKYYNLGDILRYLSENGKESPWILSINFQDQSSEYDVIWVMEWNSGDDQLRLRWMIYLVVLADAAESVRDTIKFNYHSSIWCAPFEALYGMKCRSPVLWADIGESSLIGPELVYETTDKVVLIKEKLKAARDRQKSYADNRLKPLEFEVGDRVMLKVSPWKGVIRFGKKGKLAPRYVGPFEILERIGHVAYWLRLPKQLSGVHDMFHVSNLKKCLADASLHVLLDEIKVDKTLCFVKEPVEIMDHEVKSLKRSRVLLVNNTTSV